MFKKKWNSGRYRVLSSNCAMASYRKKLPWTGDVWGRGTIKGCKIIDTLRSVNRWWILSLSLCKNFICYPLLDQRGFKQKKNILVEFVKLCKLLPWVWMGKRLDVFKKLSRSIHRSGERSCAGSFVFQEVPWVAGNLETGKMLREVQFIHLFP